MMIGKTFQTPECHGYSVKFCPFKAGRLACVTSRNFGISGGGSLFIVEDVLEATSSQVLTSHLHWKDGLFDVAWSELRPDVIVTASGDGTLQTWNLQGMQNPVALLTGHKKEVSSIDWAQTRVNEQLISGSWDGTAKIWDCEIGKCLATYWCHEAKLYSVVWSPLIPHCFASVSGDGYLHLWNTQKSTKPVLSVQSNSGENLSCSWNYYDQDLIVTSGTDNVLKGWDLRNPTTPVFILAGHSYAVKNVKFSPHMKSILSSVSYDFTTRIWDYNCPMDVQRFDHHTEFACSVDFCSQVTGLMADCGWDQKIQIFSWPCLTQDATKRIVSF